MQQIHVRWSIKIPLRDGVQLNATIYHPADGTPTPAILTMTPYIADTYHARGAYFARHGYTFVIVDVRGRGNSAGNFQGELGDGPDGYDVVTWLAAQSWCDGQVAMWGGSYAGQNQYLVAAQQPSALAALAPAAAAHIPVDHHFRGAPRGKHMLSWPILVAGVTGNWNLMLDSDLWESQYTAHHQARAPFRQLDEFVGIPNQHFQEQVTAATHDPYWVARQMQPADFARLTMPILTIAGHYDDAQRGSLWFYRQHLQHGPADAAERHFVVIGPWDHAGTRTASATVGGVRFGDAALVDLNALNRAWYDFTLRNGPRPPLLAEKNVAYYLMGAERWRFANRLDQIATGTRTFYLNSTNGQAGDLFHSGSLVVAPPPQAQPDTFVHDPLDNRIADLEQGLRGGYSTDQRFPLADQRFDVALSGDGLIYHSAPFATECEITGWPHVTLWLAMDVPDADFHVMVSEVLPDGTILKLSDAYLRARYRHGRDQEALITPGVIVRYDFDQFTFFARLFRPGSRVRLVVRCPTSLHWQINYHSGGNVDAESGADARTAHITLYHDAEHPSCLLLPVVDSGTVGQ